MEMQAAVISSYLRRNSFSVSIELAQMMFEDLSLLLRCFNDLQKKGIVNDPFLFTSDIEYLDCLWHELILHTRFYQLYCEKNFGEFIHHDPITENPQRLSLVQTAELIEKQLNIVAEYLGEDFLERIYVIYPSKIKEP